MKILTLGISVFLGLISAGFAAVAPPISIPIAEFHEVSPGVYRGASPGYDGLQALKVLGIKTDLNLDNDDDANEEEESLAQLLGIQYLPRPMSGFWSPSDENVDDILSILTNPAHYPIFIHCAHGQDRTGLIVGLFRVFHQNWSPEDAYDEMLKYNFHPSLIFLDRYFKNRTQWEDVYKAHLTALPVFE